MVRRIGPQVILLLLLCILGCGGGSGGGGGEDEKTSIPLAAIGDSLVAGYSSGGLSAASQSMSFPNLVADKMSVPFNLPYISGNGFPPQLTIVDDDQKLEAGDITRPIASVRIGSREDNTIIPHNLAIPGETSASILEPFSPYSVMSNWLSGTPPTAVDIAKVLILALPVNYKRNANENQLNKVAALNPKMIILWIGNNDIIYAATNGSLDYLVTDQTGFQHNFEAITTYLLTNTQADIFIANLPDPTKMAFLRTGQGLYFSITTASNSSASRAGRYSLQSSTQHVENLRAIPKDYLVPLKDRINSLSEDNVLSPAEITELQQEVEARNRIIENIVKQNSNRLMLVDAFTVFNNMDSTGIEVSGLRLTTSFLGGLFSLDGIHPSYVAHALLANAFLTAINQKYKTEYPTYTPAELKSIMLQDPAVINSFWGIAETSVPLGVINETDIDDIKKGFEEYKDSAGSSFSTLEKEFLSLLLGY